MEQTRAILTEATDNIQRDIKYKDGKWDMSAYDTDPSVPGRFRLSIFSLDGFVIERWRPIRGFLDTSDFRQLLAYDKPQTIHTITSQNWRTLSLPVTDGKETLGVIVLSQYYTEGDIDAIDSQLQKVGEKLQQQIQIQSGHVNTDRIDVRKVPFNISLQIVDRFNTVLLKTNNINSLDRLPNFIDSSYVKQEIHHDQSFRQVSSPQEKDNIFLVKSLNLKDEKGNVYGVVVVAITIVLIYNLMGIYAIASAIFCLFVMIIAYIFMKRVRSSRDYPIQDELAPETKANHLEESHIELIEFDKSEGTLTVNEHVIKFVYGTNQYYMLMAVFGSPKKLWANDELLDRFGEDVTARNARKAYDAMITINNKVAKIMDLKLITSSNKTYRLNPKLLTKIKK